MIKISEELLDTNVSSVGICGTSAVSMASDEELKRLGPSELTDRTLN